MTNLPSRRGLLFGAAAVSAGAVLTGARATTPTTAATRPRTPSRPPTTSPASRSPSATPVRRPTTAGSTPSTTRPSSAPRSTRTSPWRSPRAPTTPPSRSARSRPHQQRRSTSWSSCPPTARPSPRSVSRRCAPASRSSTSTASSTARRPTAAGSARQLRHGPQRRPLHRRELKDKQGAKVIELAGLDNLELTQQRTKGFDDGLKNYPNIQKVARQAAEFTVESGQAKMAQLLQASPSSTPCGTTTTTRAWARCAPSSRPDATTS